ncbi:MAG TPA: DNA-formamidopyrimidine glycosylase family protein [Chitinophagales bacterium]|nr:DNA-formamidopyrimidine glycosylase family protein [Chitinophagales bacterium]
MPEGPSIVLLKEETLRFEGKKVLAANGNAKIDMSRLEGQKIIAIQTWGKHFLICFKGFTVRIHLLMFGTYRIDDKKEQAPRLSLVFKSGEVNFYTCAIKILEGPVDDHYDWSVDVMNADWDAAAARKKVRGQGKKLICDVLLEQDIFSGVGNIIKNEVLYRVRIHPESIAAKIPPPKLKKLVDEASNYSFEFLDWKRDFVLKKHWLIHTKKECKRCGLPAIKKYTGVKKRRSFFCTNCQKLYR